MSKSRRFFYAAAQAAETLQTPDFDKNGSSKVSAACVYKAGTGQAGRGSARHGWARQGDPMRRAARVDANQAEIVDALRSVGAAVQSLAAVGRGVPDLLVGYHGKLYLLEVKMPGEKLTPRELTWHTLWDGYAYIVYSAEDAIDKVVKDGCPPASQVNADTEAKSSLAE